MKPSVLIVSASVMAMVAAACGDSKSSVNPVAPTAVVVDGSQNAESGGVSGTQAKGGVPGPPEGKGGGNGNDNGNGNGNGQQPSSNTSPSAPVVKKVEIEGLISAKGGDSITVNAQQVVVASTCPIRHGGTPFTFAALHVGDRVHVRANRTTTTTASASTTTLSATEVILQNPEDGEGSGDDTPTALVSVAATDAFASETAGDMGTFTLTRSGSATLLASPLTVTFTMTGVALNGTDYANVPLTASFAAGSATTTVVVTPTADATVEGAESVILTLTNVAPYDLGSPATATVTITDTNVPLITIDAFDSTASETGPDMGTFRFSRTGSTAAALTVTFVVTGTATNGTDYQGLPVTVTFGAGQATADLFVVPLPDATLEGP
ncbi:MAG: Calx-beta domain-containing protein, partial [Acidobacteriota bacterium]